MPRRPASQTAARKRRRNGAAAAAHSSTSDADSARSHHEVHHQGWFAWFAQETSHWAGRPVVFITAVLLILAWAVSGPMFGFSDTWQLVINTSTTIVTFLMVFLIQNTQNRDNLAVQLKLADLIIALDGAHNRMAAIEDLDDTDLEALHDEYRKRAQTTLESLKRRRGEAA